jgi:hypothetical protein
MKLFTWVPVITRHVTQLAIEAAFSAMNPDPDPAFQVNPEPDPGFKKKFRKKYT